MPVPSKSLSAISPLLKVLQNTSASEQRSSLTLQEISLTAVLWSTCRTNTTTRTKSTMFV